MLIDGIKNHFRRLTDNPLIVSYLIWLIPRVGIIFLSYFNVLPIALSTGYTVGGIVVSYHYPGYMLFSKLVHILTFNNYITYVLMHCAVASLGGICVYRLSTLLGYRSSLKWISVIGVGFMPYYFSATLFQPQFSVAFMVTTWWIVEVYHWFLEPLSKKRATWASVASLIAYLFRPYIIGLFILILGCILRFIYKKNRPKEALIKIVYSVFIFAFCFLLVKGVNSYFNIRMIANNGIANMVMGNNEYIPELAQKHNHSGWLEAINIPNTIIQKFGGAETKEEENQILLNYMIDFIKNNPTQVLKNIGWKTYRFFDWRLDDADIESKFKNLLYTVPYILYMPLGFLGALLLLYSNHKKEKLSLYLLIIAFYSIHIFIFQGCVRTRMYIEAIPIMFAVYTTHVGINKLKHFN